MPFENQEEYMAALDAGDPAAQLLAVSSMNDTNEPDHAAAQSPAQPTNQGELK